MEKNTRDLSRMLKAEKRDALGSFFKENKDEMISDSLSPGTYFRDLASVRRMKLDDIYIRAGMSLSYGRKITSGKPVHKRDTVIRLCIALGTSADEADRLLKLYKMPALYVRDKRDAVLIIAFNEGMRETGDVDALLAEYGLPPLEKCSRDE